MLSFSFRELQNKENELQEAEDKLEELEIKLTFKEETKNIALETSKNNYIDPRINVAW